jgi:hypothetical protein
MLGVLTIRTDDDFWVVSNGIDYRGYKIIIFIDDVRQLKENTFTVGGRKVSEFYQGVAEVLKDPSLYYTNDTGGNRGIEWSPTTEGIE